MDYRKDLPIPDEDNLKITYTDNLTEEEKKERATKKEEEQKQKQADKEAKELEETTKRAALATEEEKNNFDMRKEVSKLHGQAASRLKVKKLSKQEEKAMFRSIRYNFLDHETLIELS